MDKVEYKRYMDNVYLLQDTISERIHRMRITTDFNEKDIEKIKHYTELNSELLKVYRLFDVDKYFGGE